jgi:hypothetical protein
MDENKQLKEFEPYLATGMELLDTAKTLVVSNQEEKEDAELFLEQVSDVEKTITTLRETASKPFYDMHKAIIAKGKEIIKPTQDAKVLVKTRLAEYARELRRIQKEKEDALRKKKEEAQAKAKKEAEEKDAKEKERLAKIAKEQGEAEAEKEKRRIKADKDLAELKGEPENEELKKIQEEEKALKKETKTTKVKGSRDVKKFEIVDPNLIPRVYLVPDESLIRQAVGQGSNEIPGVRIRVETVVY